MGEVILRQEKVTIPTYDIFEYDKNPIRIESLSDAEQDIINSYRVLSVKDKELLTAYLDGLCKR